MKLFTLITILALNVSAVTQINLNSECFKIKDQIDRDYCKQKKSQLIRQQYTNLNTNWKKGFKSQNTKKQEQAKLNEKLLEKKEQLRLLSLELELIQSSKKVLDTAKVIKPKKKKKDNSLKGQLERALKIKL